MIGNLMCCISMLLRCVNGPQILRDWAAELSNRALSSSSLSRVRPHVLKVDVEGHDFQVLMGFLDKETPSAELPLLISFEAKSILGNLNELRTHLLSRLFQCLKHEMHLLIY
jgi:hypothetical protein